VSILRHAVVLIALAACGCAIGPDYSKPSVDTPAQFRETEGWTLAKPADAIPKGKWWEVFQDPVLDGLEEQVEVSSQTLKAAEARYRQAQAAVQAARAQFFPTLTGSAGATRSNLTPKHYNVELDARWEIDLWGRIRRLTEAARAQEEASAADLENAKLSLQAQVATSYFLLRATDTQRELLDDSATAFETNYNLTQNRYKAGVVSKVDVVLAETQLMSTRAQAIDLRSTRAQLEHAIAAAIGKAPADVTIETVPFKAHIPDIPAGIPSVVLQRRPDVASAERAAAAANAQVGVAEAAYFPALTLTGAGGYASTSLANLFSAPNRFWSIGAGLAGTILDFGARSAQVESARAGYDEAVANYRQTSLTAMQDVEDQLAILHWLGEETDVQRAAVRAARETVTITVNQYKAGTVSNLNVVIAQASQLSEERSLVNLLGRRLVASVGLIRAIGGSW
jgi:NodT family efflux transporter outer membrane factor (OMF) lipoprotein